MVAKKVKSAGGRPAKRPETEVTIGSVTIRVTEPSQRVAKRNIEDGQRAMQSIRSAFAKRGAVITKKQGKPLYFGSTDYPDLIVREVDGKRTLGKFSGDRFLPVKAKAADRSEAKGLAKKVVAKKVTANRPTEPAKGRAFAKPAANKASTTKKVSEKVKSSSKAAAA